jgi:uncharacterized protein YaaQ
MKMKMVMAVVQRDETNDVLEALIAAGHTATFMESRGGMLRQAKHALFIAVEERKLEHVLAIIQENCHSSVSLESADPEGPPSLRPPPATAQVGGAAIFIWDLDRFEIY